MTDPLAGMPHFGRYEMGLAEFEAAVDDAVAQIPAEFTAYLSNVAIVVEERYQPRPGQNPDLILLGLYRGVPLTKRTEWSGIGSLPDKICIYRQPILDLCRSREGVVRQVLITVVHEIAHHFGIDDRTLHELGWG
ncbi:putative Zn-dependent protease with MMP-like domain [Psychromicrobium silvestre]|uniref:Putative Zn-dependent protease with MMP-like domain n=1 Tax=Psychromicrobium silvestre TaxID=1645614 RepID=A0A7Y9LV24_9MICC|nr:metallopeptidase family protein [Psychromicrobium silvestre]NYE96129.1 putative Zn-dependent protease with MMP-like domain [Psychromicrobium silvestre]